MGLKDVPEDIKALLREKAKEIYAKSQAQVPKKTGTLASACEVEESNVGDWRITIRYRPDIMNEETGKYTGEYMLKQHDYMWLSHPHGGKAKFLEDPFHEVVATLPESIKDRMNWSLNKRGRWAGYEED
jgi:hypothetical protein